MAVSFEQPFPGLRPYGFDDHSFFFGRTTQIKLLRAKLRRNRFIAVVGSSGCGKSSLVKAGLLPALADEANTPGEPGWSRLEIRPQGRPIDMLSEAIAGLSRRIAGPQLKDLSDEVLLHRGRAMLRRSNFGLSEALAELPLPEGTPVLLLVDQFEELFRFIDAGSRSDRLERSDEAATFVALLLEAIHRTTPSVHVILTMRSDSIGECDRFQGLPEMISDSQFLVPRMTREQRREAIVRPVEKAGATIEPALVRRLLNDSGDEPDQLPVLQHTLMRCWQQAGLTKWARSEDAVGPDDIPGPLTVDAMREAEARLPTGRHLMLAHYEQMGGMERILSQHADGIYDELSSRGEALGQLTMLIFRALTDLDGGGHAVRRPLGFARLVSETGGRSRDVLRVLDRFRAPDCSFLLPALERRIEEDTIVDISHESLIRRWRCLMDDPEARTGWLFDELRDGRRYQALLSQAESFANNPKAIMSPAATEEQLRWWGEWPRTSVWAERYGGGYQQVQEFLEASSANLQQELGRRRRQAWIAMIVAVCATILWTILYVFGFTLPFPNDADRSGFIEPSSDQSPKAPSASDRGDARNSLLIHQATTRYHFTNCFILLRDTKAT
jgi:energy-coupling factor transporter ATP-binding protein EcfA2